MEGEGADREGGGRRREGGEHVGRELVRWVRGREGVSEGRRVRW